MWDVSCNEATGSCTPRVPSCIKTHIKAIVLDVSYNNKAGVALNRSPSYVAARNCLDRSRDINGLIKAGVARSDVQKCKLCIRFRMSGARSFLARNTAHVDCIMFELLLLISAFMRAIFDVFNLQRIVCAYALHNIRRRRILVVAYRRFRRQRRIFEGGSGVFLVPTTLGSISISTTTLFQTTTSSNLCESEEGLFRCC